MARLCGNLTTSLVVALLLGGVLASAAARRLLDTDTLMCQCLNDLVVLVCGSDGKTYTSPCKADCAGVSWKAGACPPKPCLCPENIYAPECGSDNKTYANSCELKCANVTLQHPGSCDVLSSSPTAAGAKTAETLPQSCTCEKIFMPVCGANGQTYPNSCFAQCAGQQSVTPGRCPQDCVCPLVVEPVCGYDNKTYSNSCEALCQGTWVQHNGTCGVVPKAVLTGCPDIYLPVCGSDGQTYPNSCVAWEAGITSFTEGPCDDPRLKGAEPKPVCGCPPVLAPVCGQNNITYTNVCFAECGHTTTVAYDGPCTDQCALQFATCLLEPVILPPGDIPVHKPCCAGSQCMPTVGSSPIGRLWGLCEPLVL